MDPATGLDAPRHVGIRGDKIAAISEAPLAGTTVINVTGLVVAPGFIDLHCHSMAFPLLHDPTRSSKSGGALRPFHSPRPTALRALPRINPAPHGFEAPKDSQSSVFPIHERLESMGCLPKGSGLRKPKPMAEKSRKRSAHQHAENENAQVQFLWDGIETYAALMTLR